MVNRAKSPKDVVFSKIYINLLNELVFRSLLIQLLIVGAYFTMLQVVYSEFRSELRNTYDDLVSDTMLGALSIQKSNLMTQLEDKIDLLSLHSHLFNDTLLNEPSPIAADMVSLSSGVSFSTFAFYIDQQPTVEYAALGSDEQEALQTLAASLVELNDNLVNTEDDEWVVAVAVSADLDGQYYTVMKTVSGRSVDLSSIFSYAQACKDNKLCIADCGASGTFQFSCLNDIKGAHFSPLRLSNDQDDNSQTFAYSVPTEQDTMLTFFFISSSDSFKDSLITPGIQAAIFNNATNEKSVSSPVVQYLGLNKKNGTSEYTMDPLNTNHSNVMSTWFVDLNETSMRMQKTKETNIELPFSSSSLWGHQVFGSLQLIDKYFKNLSYQTEEDALSTDFIENLILMSIFILNFLTLLG